MVELNFKCFVLDTSIWGGLGRYLGSFWEALRVSRATFLSRFVNQGSARSENCEMLEFDDLLKRFAMFSRA